MRVVRSGYSILLSILMIVGGRSAFGQSGNLVKNGSFEGGTRYWFESEGKTLVKGDAASGEYSLRIDRDGIASAAFLLEQGKPVTFSFSAKSVGGDATMGWQLTPCSREIGTKNGLTWGMRHAHPVKLIREWKRYSFSFTPTAPQDGFWPTPTYMIQIGDCDRPFLVDAVTVSHGEGDASGASAYVPRREIEVQADSPDLKGFRDPSGNLFEKGATVSIVGIASNPGASERTITLRWQLFDYEGNKPVGDGTEKILHLPAGKVVTETVPMKLSATGLVLARVTAIENQKELDHSDLPICSLPYPCEPRKPDPRERFGGSIFGLHSGALVSRMGFAWTRWLPQMAWSDTQPDGPDSFRWFHKELDQLQTLGYSCHFVMYGKPKWAFDSDRDSLPKDMKWPAEDPRWDDLQPQCAWDRFVIESVRHYKGRPLVYEIQNEPEFEWQDASKALYAKFTMRTARLIKQVNPDARVMVNNVYGIPSGINDYLLRQGAGKFIDIISWHDYHEGWLADAIAIRRMRANLDSLGCGQIEIWFNEGWAFTNTAVDEPAVALTHLNAAQSTNAMVDCVSELTAAGQEKTILFYTAYEEHGMSFWDYAGPGTMLWDYYGYPTPLVPAWNVLCHHIGLSERVAIVRPKGATLCIFQDLRNERGVVVAYADREAPSDVTVNLPLSGMTIEDAMGNAQTITGKSITLARTGRPAFLYSRDKISGKKMAEELVSLDRKNTSFVSGDGTEWKIPAAWDGHKKSSSEGNPAVADGKPLWRLDQIWPDDPSVAANYTPLPWNGTAWSPEKNGFGGQPEAKIEAAVIDLAVRGSWTGSPGQRIAGLVFVAPKSGVYRLSGNARAKPWEGGSKIFRLAIFKKDTQRATQEKLFELPRDAAPVPIEFTIDLSAGHELAFVPLMPDWHNATHISLENLSIRLLADSSPAHLDR